MTKLLMICVDGLDYDFAHKHNLHLPYEAKLEIPKELYRGDNPWTPRVWGSIFAGRIEVYPDIVTTDNVIRRRIRKYLKSHGIRWYREGWKVYKTRSEYQEEVVPRFIYMAPILEESVLEKRYSFTHHVPAVSCDYMYGGDSRYSLHEFEEFNFLLTHLSRLNFDIAAVYCRIIDRRGHAHIEGNERSEKILLNLYESVFLLANVLSKSGDVMLISDHGTLGGTHTHHAYLGCTKPVEAKSVIGVRKDVERILG